MTPTDWIQAISMVVLVIVTIFYARRTHVISKATREQAAANVKMAEEMREQRLAMYKPHIVLEKTSVPRGRYFMKNIGVKGKNEQGGTAVNVELCIVHPLFKFSKFRHPNAISVGAPLSERTLKNVEQPSVDEDPGKEINPVALAVANYEDVSGNKWHSTLELRWNEADKDVTPGRKEVGVSGHLR